MMLIEVAAIAVCAMRPVFNGEQAARPQTAPHEDITLISRSKALDRRLPRSD
jgi:hypothetical protein